MDFSAPSLTSNDRGLHLTHCHGNWQAPSACRTELCSQGHLGNIAKQQFALWQPRLCPDVDGEAQQVSLNGVDFTRLWRTSQGFTLSIAMATGKVQSSSLVLGLNSALKEHFGDFGKQQFPLWHLRLCSQLRSEG